MKYAKILDGVVDTVAVDQPMRAMPHTFTIEVPVKGIVENGEAQITETKDQEHTVSIQVPEDGWIEVADEIFAGFTVNEDGIFSPPPPPPPPVAADFTLNSAQFDVALALMELTIEQIDAAIDQIIVDATQNVFAKAKMRKASFYSRTDPLLTTLGPVLGVTDEQIDEAWMQAKDFQ